MCLDQIVKMVEFCHYIEILINCKNGAFISYQLTVLSAICIFSSFVPYFGLTFFVSSSNMLKFDQILTFEDWGNKWGSKWGNKMGMWDITTGNLNVWVTKCQGLNFILPKL